jgi:hypothetical protein
LHETRIKIDRVCRRGPDEYVHKATLVHRLAESGFRLKHVHNGSAAGRSESFADLAAESWAQLIERRLIRLPLDERLVAQLTSRQRRYDSRGRLRLEPKDDLRNRGVESPDRADAVCGAIMMRLQADPYAFDESGRQANSEMMQMALRKMERSRPIGYEPFVDWNNVW